MNFGSLLQKYRKKAEVSQKELANIIGIDPTYLSKIEHNKRKVPSRSVIVEIGEALELREEELDQLLISAGHQPLTLFDLGFDQNDVSLKKHINVLKEIKKKAPFASYIRAKEEISDYLEHIRTKYTHKVDEEYLERNTLANYLYSKIRNLGLRELYRLFTRPLGGALVLHNGKILLSRIGKSPLKGWWHIPCGFVNPAKGDKNSQDIAVRMLKRCLPSHKREKLEYKIEKELTAPGEPLENLDSTSYALRLGYFPTIFEFFKISLKNPEIIKNTTNTRWFEVTKLDQIKDDIHPTLAKTVGLYFRNKTLEKALTQKGEESIQKVLKKKDFLQKQQRFLQKRILITK